MEARGGLRRGLSRGLRAAVPVMVGYLPAAAAFGVAARGAGLSTAEALCMSLVVYSGAGQFALVGLVAAGASLPFAGITALVLSLRHVLYGPALAPRLRRLGPWRAAPLAFGLTDEVFAVASVELRGRQASLWWLAALEFGVYVTWALGTWVGAGAGAAITGALPSLAPALGFALPALFVALLVPLVSPGGGGATGGGTDVGILGAVSVAGAIAAVLHLAGVGSWGLLAAGVAGPAFGLLLGARRRRGEA